MTSASVPAHLAALPRLVQSTFESARSSGALTFFDSIVKEIPVNGLTFQVRFAPGLANKPKAPKSDTDSKPADPFAHPPPDLFVADVSPAHFLVLNKFPVVREHFILATTPFKPQTHLLELDDLAAAFNCIQAYAAQRRRLFAFFNSGPESGASQAHRHLQLVPEDGMLDGLDTTAHEHGQQQQQQQRPWTLLTDTLLHASHRHALPFAVWVDWLPEADPEALYVKYLALYARAFAVLQGRTPTADELTGEAAFSYNLALTRDTMVLCPREREGAALAGDDGREVGRLALNGTLLAGTALVRTREELDFLAARPGALGEVMAQIGRSPVL